MTLLERLNGKEEFESESIAKHCAVERKSFIRYRGKLEIWNMLAKRARDAENYMYVPADCGSKLHSFEKQSRVKTAEKKKLYQAIQ